MLSKRIFGDYQTPDDFCHEICAYLQRKYNLPA